MNLTENKLARLVLSILSLVCAIYFTYYYWTASAPIEIISISKSTLFVLLFYLIFQVLLGQSSKNKKWVNKIYLLGLVCMLVPVRLTTPENIETMFLVVKLGVVFFYLPPIIELLKKQK